MKEKELKTIIKESVTQEFNSLLNDENENIDSVQEITDDDNIEYLTNLLYEIKEDIDLMIGVLNSGCKDEENKEYFEGLLKSVNKLSDIIKEVY